MSVVVYALASSLARNNGESLVEDYPMPPGRGRFWVTFERIIFSDHLVGLNYSQVKEYTRLRSEAAPKEPEDDSAAAEHAAVQEAVRRIKENSALGESVQPPVIAYGIDMPGHPQIPIRHDLKGGCAGGFFAGVGSAPLETAPEPRGIPTPGQSIAAHQNPFRIDPRIGTRPTQILIGHWKMSGKVKPEDRHAVFGVWGQNGVFRAKVIQRTRDGRLINGRFVGGRFVNGNYPYGASALWIPHEEVELEPHLKSLNKQEIREYCRVRQYQLDRGETSAERMENETKAVFEAQIRVDTLPYEQPHNIAVPTSRPITRGEWDKRLNGQQSRGSYPLRQSRRAGPLSVQVSTGDDERHSIRLEGVEVVERVKALACRETAGANAAQDWVDRHSIHREHKPAAVAAGAGNAAGVATASNMPPERHHNVNGRIPFHMSEDMQRLNEIRARQEAFRTTGRSDDVKTYDGNQYRRKTTGPFMRKLVSRGAIINIDGDDYVEYRVLTKPSFF